VNRNHPDRTFAARRTLSRHSNSNFRTVWRVLAVVVFWAGFVVATPAQNPADSESIGAIQSAIRGGDNDRAVTLAQEQLQKWPNDVRLWALKGVAYSHMGRNREALAAYNKALTISPDYLAALEGAAQIEYAAGSDRAIPLLNRILKVRPDEPTTHAMLAALAYKKHDCPLAVKHFQQSGPVLSSQPSALEEFGSCLMEIQKPDKALPIFQQLHDAQPDDPHARYNLAVVQLAAAHAKDAITTLQPLVDAEQPDPDALDLASAAYEETGDTPRAVSLLRQAIVANPKNAKYYVDFAALSYKHESFQVGVEMVDAGLEQLPKVASLYVARGILFIQMGQFEKGQADFETANRLDPKQASAAVAEGLAQFQNSDLDQALKTVESQLKLHPNDAFLHYLKAEIIVQGGPAVDSAPFNEALDAAARAVQLQPNFPLARNVLGNLYFESGQNERAIEQCRIILRDNPDDQIATYHLLLALRKTKDTNGEIPGLVKRLAELRAQTQANENSANKFKLYIPKTEASSNPAPANP
jgi:tetratricopeptide (TPR) repeat protein